MSGTERHPDRRGSGDALPVHHPHPSHPAQVLAHPHHRPPQGPRGGLASLPSRESLEGHRPHQSLRNRAGSDLTIFLLVLKHSFLLHVIVLSIKGFLSLFTTRLLLLRTSSLFHSLDAHH